MAEPSPGGQQPTDGYSGSMPPPEAGASQQQSAQQAWRREPFFWTDQASTATFSELPERHISGTRVQQTVVETGHELHQITTSAFRSLLGDVDYDAFLNGLLYPGEKPQLPPPHQFVDYGAVVMSVGDKGTDNYHVLHELPPGRCMLTSSRLIFLSSTAHTSNTLQAYGDPKLKTLKTGGYTVSSSACDTRLFYPLPLSAFLTVRLGVNSGVLTTSHVVASGPCCKWRMCCSCCIKQWTPSPPQTSSTNERSLIMDVALPPWGRPATIQMELAPQVDFRTAKAFVSHLQLTLPGSPNGPAVTTQPNPFAHTPRP